MGAKERTYQTKSSNRLGLRVRSVGVRVRSVRARVRSVRVRVRSVRVRVAAVMYFLVTFKVPLGYFWDTLGVLLGHF